MFESKEDLIVKRIKDFVNKNPLAGGLYIMLRNGHIHHIGYYYDMVKSGKINPQDTYVYIRKFWASSTAEFYYPFLYANHELPYAYLSKLGFYYKDDFGSTLVVPATGLKYVADVVGYAGKKYLSIELVNLDVMVINTNLSKIVVEVLDGKLISGGKELTRDEDAKINRMYKSQKLFAGHNFDEAWFIIRDYYNKGNTSLAKEAARIVMDYDRIFHSYRVCYETETWEEVDCLSIR